MLDFNLARFLYEEGSLGVFVLVTIILGGGAAFLAGRAIAGTWRPWWHVVLYMLVLAIFVRFLHFALFEGTLIEPHYYAVDAAFCLLFGLLGYRMTRAGQMVTQYRWLYGPSGPLSWVRR
jgi:hypothetical protein